jgi:hypothetical protein
VCGGEELNCLSSVWGEKAAALSRLSGIARRGSRTCKARFVTEPHLRSHIKKFPSDPGTSRGRAVVKVSQVPALFICTDPCDLFFK